MKSIKWIIGIGFIILIFVGTSLFINNSYHETDNFKQRVEEKFNAKIISPVLTSDTENYNAGRLVGPILIEYNNDIRLYDIYLLEKNGEMNGYIKNEKGAYIPITDITISYTEKHNEINF